MGRRGAFNENIRSICARLPYWSRIHKVMKSINSINIIKGLLNNALLWKEGLREIASERAM